MMQICVVGREWKFRALVRAELREQGYEALGLESLDQLGSAVASGELSPAVIVFDLAESDNRDRDLATLRQLSVCVPVILIASRADFPDLSDAPQGVTVLFRPLAVADVVRRVCALAGQP